MLGERAALPGAHARPVAVSYLLCEARSRQLPAAMDKRGHPERTGCPLRLRAGCGSHMRGQRAVGVRILRLSLGAPETYEHGCSPTCR